MHTDRRMDGPINPIRRFGGLQECLYDKLFPHRKWKKSNDCITKPNRLMLFRETVAVYCENHTEHTNTLCGQNAEFLYVRADGTYIYRIKQECFTLSPNPECS
jgi:hypothetical protein